MTKHYHVSIARFMFTYVLDYTTNTAKIFNSRTTTERVINLDTAVQHLERQAKHYDARIWQGLNFETVVK